MSARIVQFPGNHPARVELIKSLLRKLMQVTGDRRKRAAFDRADPAVRAEVRALERLIEAMAQGDAVVAVPPRPMAEERRA